MAHFCVFCERNYRSFVQLRYHTCTPNSLLVTESSSDAEADKENRVIVLDVDYSSDEEMLGVETTRSLSNKHNQNALAKDGLQDHITDTVDDFIIELNEDFETNNEDNMGKTAVKTIDEREPTSFMQGGKRNGIKEINESVNLSEDNEKSNGDTKDDFLDELENSADSGSGSIKREDNDIVDERPDIEEDGDTSEADFEESGYVYVFDTDENFLGSDNNNDRSMDGTVNTNVEAGVCMLDTNTDMSNNNITNELECSRVPSPFKGHFNGESFLETDASTDNQNYKLEQQVRTASAGNSKQEPVTDGSNDNKTYNKDMQASSDIVENSKQENCNQSKIKKTEISVETLSKQGPSKLVGASKRKRKFSLENTISQIIRTKTICRDKMDCLTAFNNDDPSLTVDDVDNILPVLEEDNQPNKVMIQEKTGTSFNIKNTTVLPDEHLTCNLEEKNESSPNLSASHSNSKQTASGRPGKPNRRKRSFVPRVKIVNEQDADDSESEVFDIVKDMQANFGESCVPLDFTAVVGDTSGKESAGMTRGYANNGGINMSPMDLTIMDLSKRTDSDKIAVNGKQELGQVKMEPMDLTVGGKNQGETVDDKANVFPGIKADGLINPVNQAQFLEMMKKLQSQFPAANLMQQNGTYLQFQMWMQNMLLSSFRNAVNNVSKAMKNDHNENIMKQEFGDTNASLTHNFQKFNLEYMYKAGLLQSNMLPPFAVNQNPLQPFAGAAVNSMHALNSASASTKLENSIKTDTDTCKSSILNGVAKMEPTSSSDEIKPTKMNMHPALNGMFINQSIGDEGEVRFHVKDNEQIQSIVKNLVQNGKLDIKEGSENAELCLKFICRICGQKFFHMEHLTRHVKKQHIMKKFQCTECERSFHDAGNYRQHMRVHDVNDVPFECPECQRKFRHKCTLKVHMRIHSGEKPFKCEICPASFKISSGLQTHMRKHTGETPYACEFCNMRFKCQSNLKQHLFQHTQVRPFSCEVCGKSYSRKSIRDSHLQTHFK